MADTLFAQKLRERNKKFAEAKIENVNKKQQEARENAGFWERFVDTFIDTFTTLGGGLSKGVEGIVDAGVGVAGSIGSVFGVDTQWAEDIIKFDATNEWYYKGFENEATKNSWWNDVPIVKDVLGGVGQMLPTIALSAIGLGGVGVAGIVTSAGGTGVEEALNEDAEFGQAMLYGVSQAGIEGLIEGVTAGLGKGITTIGKSVGKTTGKSVAKTVGKVMLEESVSEGIEEGLTALVNPFSKTIYKGADVLETYKDMTFYLDAGQQALVGGIVGGITGGSSAKIRQIALGGKTNYNISQSAQEIATLDTKENNLWKNGKLDAKALQKIQNQRQIELENISSQLMAMSEADRVNALEKLKNKKIDITGLFNEDGSINYENTQNWAISENEAQVVENTQNTKRKPLATDNIEAYHPSLRNKVLEFAPTSNPISENIKTAKNTIMAINPNAKVVVAEELSVGDAFYDPSSKIFYISNKANSIELGGHEITHSLEGTKEYKALKDYVLGNVENLETKIAEKIEIYKNVNVEQKQGENGEAIARYEAETEIVAEEMGKLLSDQTSIDRVVKYNKSVAARIVQWIKDAIAKLTKRGIKGEYYNQLRTAEKLYAKAIKTSFGGVSLAEGTFSDNYYNMNERERLDLFIQTFGNNQENVYNNEKGGVNNGEFSEERYSINKRSDLGNISGQERTNKVGTIRDFSENVEKAWLDNETERLEYNKEISPELNQAIKEFVKRDNNEQKNSEQRNLYRSEGEAWISDSSYRGRIQDISSEFGINENVEAVKFLKEVYNNSKLYDVEKVNKYNLRVDKFGETVNIINHKNLTFDLQEICERNKKMGINTFFYLKNDKTNSEALGFFTLKDKNIFILFDELNANFVETNRHEVMHFIQKHNPQISNIFMQEVDKVLTDEEKTKFYNTYYDSYIKSYNNFSVNNIEQILWNEIYADIYSLSLKVKNQKEIYNIVEKIDIMLADNYEQETKRYSLKDNQGNNLSPEQAEYFKDSKVRDENGDLLAVYHGTEGEFYTFDKALRGANTGTKDAKLGFFFTNKELIAKDYAIYAQDGKLYNLMNLIAQGDPEVFDLLRTVDGHKQLDQTELVKEYARILEKAENYVNDVLEVYLNIENPKIVDWKGKTYKKNAMLKLLTEAIMEKRDGVIIKNIEDSVNQDLGISDVYVAFEPNQIKLTTNKQPTLNPDMRYSLQAGYTPEVQATTANVKESYGIENINNVNEVVKKVSSKLEDTFLTTPDKQKFVKNIDTGIELTITKAGIKETFGNKKYYLDYDEDLKLAKLATMEHLAKLIKYGEVRSQSASNYHNPNSTTRFTYLQAPIIIDGIVYNVTIDIKETEKGNRFYIHGLNIKKSLGLTPYGDPKVSTFNGSNQDSKEAKYPVSTERKSNQGRHSYSGRFASEDLDSTPYGESKSSTFIGLNQVPTNNTIPQNTDAVNNYYDNNQKKDTRYLIENRELTKGQVKKEQAKGYKTKVYDKQEADRIVNNLLEMIQNDSYYAEIKGKTKAELVDYLWIQLNSKDEGYRGEVALKVADYLIDNAIMQDYYQDYANQDNINTLDVLREYLHKVDLSAIKGEIKHKFDKDNSPYLIWGARKDTRGLPADVIAQELAEEGISISATNEADIFFEMYDLYKHALSEMKSKSKITSIRDVIGKSEVEKLRQDIAREVLMSYDKYGKKTKFAEYIEKSQKRLKTLRLKFEDYKAYKRAEQTLKATLNSLKKKLDDKAGWKVSEDVKTLVNELVKLESYKGNVTKDARNNLRKVGKHLEILYGFDKNDNSIYGELKKQEVIEFYDIINELTDPTKEETKFTTEEILDISNVLRNFMHVLQNYNLVSFNGEKVEIDKIAEQGVKETLEAEPFLKSPDSNIFVRFFNYIIKGIKHIFINPKDRMAEMGLYRENSVMMQIYRDMVNGDSKRAKFVMEANMLFDDFYKRNKNYNNVLQEQMVINNGYEDITLHKRQALSLYLTSLRPQGRSHIFGVDGDEGIVKLLDNKFSTRGKMKKALDKGVEIKVTEEMLSNIEKQFTQADREYIDLVKTFFNENSRKAKQEVDIALYGVSNVEDRDYFPLEVSSDELFQETTDKGNINQSVLNFGFNKTVKPNSSNMIVIDGVDNILAEHIRKMSLYVGYALPLNAYNKIMNRKVVLENGSGINMHSAAGKIDSGFKGYMDKLWLDVQGLNTKNLKSVDKFFGKLMSRIRWATANSALGLNPKVLLTQTLSLASAQTEFNPKYIVKGMKHFFGEKEKIEMAKYAPLMWERNLVGSSVDVQDIRQIGKEIGGRSHKVIAKATDGLNKLTTTPISWMDSNVIQSLWFAAQYEVAETKGLEFGTDANKVEAGKRLTEVVFTTQQTSDALGRSEWMRSDNEFIKFLRMFGGDGIQLAGRKCSAIRKHHILKKVSKCDNLELAQYAQKELPSSKKGLAKTESAFILNQVMLLAIAMAFKWLKGKDDDEEWSEVARNEAMANLVGLLPFGGDLANLMLGYEPTNMAYTSLSNTFNIVKDTVESIDTFANGGYQDDTKLRASARKSILNASKLFGIPLQNLESYTKGIIGKISPATKEEYEALFKTKSTQTYLDKVEKALANGDEEYADRIINIMFDSRTGKIKDDKVMEVTRDLIEQGYDVLPRVVNKSITYEGVEYTLTDKQHKQFTKIYSQANESVKKMVNLKAFAKIDDEAKAKAMTFIYNYYYNLAIEDMLGEDLESKTILFAEAIPIEQLAMAISQAQIYTADTDKKGVAISGSRKAKIQSYINSLGLTAVQKYMIMGYLGYTNKYGETQVKSYINRLKLTKSQKEKLFEMSGY